MKNLFKILITCLFFYNCSETDVLNETGNLEVTDFHLPVLPPNFEYEGWLLVDGSYVSVGKITNDSLTNNRARFSKIEMEDLNRAQSFAITVETSSSPAPSNFVLLVGDFNGNTATLSPNAEISNGVLSLANRISASYTIQNASVPATDTGNYDVNGVWFFKGEGANSERTLELDYYDLKYQAWLVKTIGNSNYNLNIGVIENDTIADNSRIFIPSPYASNIPDFPGEDFLQQPGGENVPTFPENFFPVDVRGAKIIITPILSGYNSIETPFPVHILEATIPTDAIKDPNLTRDFQINTNFGAKATKL